MSKIDDKPLQKILIYIFTYPNLADALPFYFSSVQSDTSPQLHSLRMMDQVRVNSRSLLICRLENYGCGSFEWSTGARVL